MAPWLSLSTASGFVWAISVFVAASQHVPCTVERLESCNDEAKRQLPALQNMTRTELAGFIDEKDARLNAARERDHASLEAGNSAGDAMQRAELQSLAELAYNVYMVLITRGKKSALAQAPTEHAHGAPATGDPAVLAEPQDMEPGVGNPGPPPGALAKVDDAAGAMRSEKKKAGQAADIASDSGTNNNATASGAKGKSAKKKASGKKGKNINNSAAAGGSASKKASEVLAQPNDASLLQGLGRAAASWLGR